MTESTARAERLDRNTPPPPAYTWSVPDKPVTVRIPLSTLENLEREAIAGYRSLSSRGSEIGGLLFGSVTPGNPALVQIEAYEMVACEYAGGPLYRLSGAELARLDQLIEQRRAAGMRAVGYFRSHTRKGLSLDAGDLAILDARFTGAQDIALLLRPSAGKNGTAGFFIREDGQIRGDATYLEFPFLSGQHEAVKPPETATVAGPRNLPAAPTAPMTPRPVTRAQIVPIASRREIIPPPVVEPPVDAVEDRGLAAPAPVAPAKVEAVVERPIPVPAPAPVQVEAAAPAPLAENQPTAAEVPLPAFARQPSEDRKPAEEQPKAAEAPRRSSRLIWVAVGVLGSAALGAGFLFTSGVLHNRGVKLPAAVPEAGLALRVERNEADILLTWNRDADSIKRATRAVLSISDGPQQENVDMDLLQLRTGSIVYSPVTSDVVFRMDVTTSGNSQPASETVRVLRTRPSPMPDAAGKSAPPAAANGTPDADPAAPAPEEPKAVLAQPLKPFRAESLAQRLRPTRPAEMPEAPGVSAPPVSLPNVNLGSLDSALPPPPAAPPKAPEAAPNVGGQIQPAVLLRRTNPEFPKLAREAGAGGAVQLTATIGVDGKVKSVKVVSGHPLLRQAATDALKQWVYRPTLLNGKPVESETQVILNFKNDRQ